MEFEARNDNKFTFFKGRKITNSGTRKVTNTNWPNVCYIVGWNVRRCHLARISEATIVRIVEFSWLGGAGAKYDRAELYMFLPTSGGVRSRDTQGWQGATCKDKSSVEPKAKLKLKIVRSSHLFTQSLWYTFKKKRQSIAEIGVFAERDWNSQKLLSNPAETKDCWVAWGPSWWFAQPDFVTCW